MSEKQPSPLSDKMLDHVKYFIFFTISYYVSNFLTIMINKNFQSFSAPIYAVFGDIALSVFIFVMIFIVGRLLLLVFPELGIEQVLPIYIVIIPSLIISHPILVNVSGSKFLIRWLVIDIVMNNGLLELFIEMLLFSAAGYGLYMMQSRIELKKSRLHQIIRYLGTDFYLILTIIVIVIDLISSFASNDYESVSLGYPIKYLLIYLFFMVTSPIDENEDDITPQEEKTELAK